MKSKQSGITLPGLLFVLVIVGFFSYIAIRLVPSYMEYMGVVKAIEQEATVSLSGKTLEDVRRDVMFKISFQYTDDATVKPKDITLSSSDHAAMLNVSYDKVVPLFYNISFLLHFEKSVQLQGMLGE